MNAQKKFNALTLKEKSLIMICGVVLILSPGYTFVLEPKLTELSKVKLYLDEKTSATSTLENEINELQRRIPEEERTISEELALKKEVLEELKAKVDERAHNALSSDINHLTQELISKGKHLDVAEIDTVEQKTESKDFTAFHAQQISLSLRGSYKDITQYINNVKNSHHVFLVQNYTLDATNHKELNMKLTLETFLRKEPNE